MGLNRRSFIKLSALSGVALGASHLNASELKAKKRLLRAPNKNKKRVVIVGGGMGGVSVAEAIKDNDPKDKIEVIILERNARYFTCPMSNTLFGEIKAVEDAGIRFEQGYTSIMQKHNIDVIITEVIGADRKAKKLQTTKGEISYDYVVVAPGIGYNYKKLFPKWSDEKIAKAMRYTPAAMHSDSGVEKRMLLDQLHEWAKEGGKGYFVIVPPKGGKVRCKPAPYERACMVSEYIKKHKLPGKVYILDNSPKPQAKGPKFIEVFIRNHSETILFNGMSGKAMLSRIKAAGFTLENFKKKENFAKIEDSFASCDIKDVDFDKKHIIFDYSDNFDDDAKPQTIEYKVANIIPFHKANETVEMFDVACDDWGGILCAPNRCYSKEDKSLYVAGDAMGFHKLSPSAQTATSVGRLTGESIAKRILTGKDELDLSKAAITCFSMVSDNPLKAIEISKDVMVDKNGRAKPTNKRMKYSDGEGLIGWYQGVVEAPFIY